MGVPGRDCRRPRISVDTADRARPTASDVRLSPNLVLPGKGSLPLLRDNSTRYQPLKQFYEAHRGIEIPRSQNAGESFTRIFLMFSPS